MTKLSCRARDSRLRVAYIIDAYMHACGKSFDTTIKPENSFARAGTKQHPYSMMWGLIGRCYKRLGWDQMCDPEIDQLWKTAISVGIQVFNTKLTPSDVLAAKQRWHLSHWYRYEYKRSNRRMAVMPWLKLGAVI